MRGVFPFLDWKSGSLFSVLGMVLRSDIRALRTDWLRDMRRVLQVFFSRRNISLRVMAVRACSTEMVDMSDARRFVLMPRMKIA